MVYLGFPVSYIRWRHTIDLKFGIEKSSTNADLVLSCLKMVVIYSQIGFEFFSVCFFLFHLSEMVLNTKITIQYRTHTTNIVLYFMFKRSLKRRFSSGTQCLRNPTSTRRLVFGFKDFLPLVLDVSCIHLLHEDSYDLQSVVLKQQSHHLLSL